MNPYVLLIPKWGEIALRRLLVQLHNLWLQLEMKNIWVALYIVSGMHLCGENTDPGDKAFLHAGAQSLLHVQTISYHHLVLSMMG